MGEQQFMLDQVEEKLAQGFKCIKMKVGAIAFEQELAILKQIRTRYSKEEMVLLRQRSLCRRSSKTAAIGRTRFTLHRATPPPRELGRNAKACASTPLPIALDEELIGVFSREEKIALLEEIQPQYIILKPSFIGGLRGASEWTALAKERGIGAWVTSALESNIGLNAIAQWTYAHAFDGHQGLGTGSLFTNNFPSPLVIKNGYLSVDKSQAWNTRDLQAT